MFAYYNEFDPFAAEWLRELIKAGLIMDGFVDQRSIIDVKPEDLKCFTRCHFFAGIGGWDCALQLAEWPEDKPVWTGSCPCQPFSVAGKQKGRNDERHLWPIWFKLITEFRPPVIFGEQVASAINHGWLDEICDDLGREDYTVRAEVRPASSVGAPHRRDRLWFVADTSGGRWGEKLPHQRRGVKGGEEGETIRPSRNGDFSPVANPDSKRLQRQRGFVQVTGAERWERTQRYPWESGVWIDCPDGKQRLVEPSIPLLANGVSNRVGKLRGFGNAIVPHCGASFIRAFLEVENENLHGM